MTTPIETVAPVPRKKPMPVNPAIRQPKAKHVLITLPPMLLFFSHIPAITRREAITVLPGGARRSLLRHQGEEMLNKLSPEKVETDKEDRGEAVNFTSKAGLRLTR